MPVEFKLPDVGEGIDGAEVLEWKVAVGDAIREDDPLVEVETDKATTVIPSPVDGVVEELRFAVGERVPVGAVIVVIEPAAAPDPANDGRRRAPETRPLASPAVRRLARDLGVDLATVTGTGPRGRIQRQDVPPQSGARPYSPVRPAPNRVRTVPLRGVRRTIAERMTLAWQTVPHIIDYRELDATALLAAREAIRAAAVDDATATSLTLTPLIVKACCLAAAEHPYANASIDLDRQQILLHPACHVGVAVSTPDGLMVPVVRDADSKTLLELGREIADLAAAARDRRLTSAELTGATFTVNNFGALGVWLGTPIINPPQVINIGVGRAEQRPVARDGQVVIRTVMALSVSGDHRVLDGDTLAGMVGRVVELLEQPTLMLAGAR
jgi:pyruvate dehydrogenase E2 component (dihydrolipoamide acetyltransferase)